MMDNILEYLQIAVTQMATDIFITAGREVSVKLHGKIEKIGEERLAPKDSRSLIRGLYDLSNRPFVDSDDSKPALDDDFSLSVPGLARFRINVYQQRSSLAAAIHIINFGIPDWKELNIPEEIMGIADIPSGLVLVTGPAGSGKSTTLACVINHINQTHDMHIVTIEDPIEFLYRNEKSIVSQREVSIDTSDYITAIKASMKQSPDVIFIGELLNKEIVKAAMDLAENGHLVISTMHTTGISNTVERMLGLFDESQQESARLQIANVLKMVVSQTLSREGEIATPKFEIVPVTEVLSNMIKNGKVQRLSSVVQI